MQNYLFGQYDREKAVEYARQWAYKRNPAYYNFDGIGGDCTNYASQCVYAGTGVMNFTPVYGWYYLNINKRSPAWSSVKYIHQFLTTNKGLGPYGTEVDVSKVEVGDLVQLIITKQDYQHTSVITLIDGEPNLDTIYVSAHSFDTYNKALTDYSFKKVRFIRIEGFRYL